MAGLNNQSFGAVKFIHQIISNYIRPGDICIDATCGRGNDTLFLCQLVGEKGKVLAFDIQKEAIDSTRELITDHGYSEVVQTIFDSHINIDCYTKENSVFCIMFNFGWLPGGNHLISTRSDTSITAIEKGLNLLSPGGIMSLCLYSGKDSGFDEKNDIIAYLKTIDYHKYTVIVSDFINHANFPPIPVLIYKK